MKLADREHIYAHPEFAGGSMGTMTPMSTGCSVKAGEVRNCEWCGGTENLEV